MEAITYSSFRNALSSTMDRVNQDHAPILVTRQNGAPIVVMSLADFESYQETAYLMASPKNAQRLRESIAQMKAGNQKEHALLED